LVFFKWGRGKKKKGVVEVSEHIFFFCSLAGSRPLAPSLARARARSLALPQREGEKQSSRKKGNAPGHHGPKQHRQVDRVRADHPHAQVRQLEIKVPLPGQGPEAKGREPVKASGAAGAGVGGEEPLERGPAGRGTAPLAQGGDLRVGGGLAAAGVERVDEDAACFYGFRGGGACFFAERRKT
jgi:hypothetical protein